MDGGLFARRAEGVRRALQDGLIYRGKRMVNWDPAARTAISDDEVREDRKTRVIFALQISDLDDAGNETRQFIIVATTRPETMLGDEAVAVHPKDERYTALVDKRVRLPLVGRLIPIVADEYSDPREGHRRGENHPGA